MTQIKAASDRSGITQHLIKEVLTQISDNATEALKTLRDVYDHGADAGYPGFTWTSDTAAFYEANKKEIVELVERTAEEFDTSPLDFIATFNVLAGPKGAKAPYYRDIAKALYGKPSKTERDFDDYLNIANALAWFILEETARAFYDY